MKQKKMLLIMILAFVIVFIAVSVAFFNLNQEVAAKKDIMIFSAACFSPFLEGIRDNAKKYLGLALHTEISGSQVACRKVTELHREADLLMVADNNLFKKIAADHVNWRIDFGYDEVVLAVGLRAQYVDQAEKDWVGVLLDKEITLGRVDESLGPIGYRTLMVWQLKEMSGYPGLKEKLKKKTSKVVDHVMSLAALLKAGDVDYGFLYRSTCMKHDIRFIALDRQVNLSALNVDYSRAKIKIKNRKSTQAVGQLIELSGAPVVFSLAVPNVSQKQTDTTELIRFLLSQNPDCYGFRFIKPRFYGSPGLYSQFKDIADHGGTF